MGILFMKLDAACPHCRRNVFGKGMYKFRNMIFFLTRIGLCIRKTLKCHGCFKEIELTIEKGRYKAGPVAQ